MEKYEDLPLTITGDLFCHDASYPSDNDLEIPTLRFDMQAQELTKPFCAWGEQKRTYDLQHSGSLHFYVDDYRFNAVYEHPDRILKANPKNIVEPNFSLYADTPIAFGLQAIYKKRWIARCMQERNIRIFVDLNVNAKFYKLNMLGVPIGWSSFCTRGYSDRLNNLEYEYKIAQSWAKENQLLFVIYGGGINCLRFAQEHGCVYVTPLITEKKKIKALKKIEEEAVAFFSEEFSLKGITDRMAYDRQVFDFRNDKLLQN